MKEPTFTTERLRCWVIRAIPSQTTRRTSTMKTTICKERARHVTRISALLEVEA